MPYFCNVTWAVRREIAWVDLYDVKLHIMGSALRGRMRWAVHSEVACHDGTTVKLHEAISVLGGYVSCMGLSVYWEVTWAAWSYQCTGKLLGMSSVLECIVSALGGCVRWAVALRGYVPKVHRKVAWRCLCTLGCMIRNRTRKAALQQPVIGRGIYWLKDRVSWGYILHGNIAYG